jgi:hypothetical protein
MLTTVAKSSGHGGDESAQGEWRTGRVLPPLESRNRSGEREPRGTRNFSSDGTNRPERREMALASTESGVEKWERRGPLPPLETSDRRSRTSYSPRSGSGTFTNAPNRSPSRESPADGGEWRVSKPLMPAARSDGSIVLCLMIINIRYRYTPGFTLSRRIFGNSTQKVDTSPSQRASPRVVPDPRRFRRRQTEV